MVRVVLRPTIRWPGVIRLTATQKITWGATTTTLAVAVLLARFVSGLSPITHAHLRRSSHLSWGQEGTPDPAHSSSSEVLDPPRIQRTLRWASGRQPYARTRSHT